MIDQIGNWIGLESLDDCHFRLIHSPCLPDSVGQEVNPTLLTVINVSEMSHPVFVSEAEKISLNFPVLKWTMLSPNEEMLEEEFMMMMSKQPGREPH